MNAKIDPSLDKNAENVIISHQGIAVGSLQERVFLALQRYFNSVHRWIALVSLDRVSRCFHQFHHADPHRLRAAHVLCHSFTRFLLQEVPVSTRVSIVVALLNS